MQLVVLFILYMEYYGKNKKHYRGIWIAFVSMIAVPLALFALFYFAIMTKVTVNNAYAFYISLAFSGLLGFLFGIVCILTGLIHDQFVAMFSRIRETIECFGWFNKDGFKYYFNEFINDGGPLMWGFILVILAMGAVSAIGFANFFMFYHA